MYFGLLTESIDMDGGFHSLDYCGSVVISVGWIREVQARLVINIRDRQKQ